MAGEILKLLVPSKVSTVVDWSLCYFFIVVVCLLVLELPLLLSFKGVLCLLSLPLGDVVGKLGPSRHRERVVSSVSAALSSWLFSFHLSRVKFIYVKAVSLDILWHFFVPYTYNCAGELALIVVGYFLLLDLRRDNISLLLVTFSRAIADGLVVIDLGVVSRDFLDGARHVALW